MRRRLVLAVTPLVGAIASLFAIATSAGGASPAPSTEASKLLVAGAGTGAWRLRVDGAGARVERAAGRIALPLPPAATMDAFQPTGGGWVAAGSTPVAGGRDLALWRGDGARAVAMPAPPARRGALRVSPVLLAHDGELVAMAWLEGEAHDRLGVQAATWDGHAWSTPAVVAPPGRGSQLALTGDVLADGSLLLAWSAFDGTADAIRWSRRRGARWSEPRAIARPQPVPDITPALRADGSSGSEPGALLAWSRYDGNDYRLLLARFDGRQWSAPRTVGGKGTLFPSWQQDALLFRDASHGAWVGATVTANDALALAVAKAAPPLPRPAIVRDGDRLAIELP